MSFGRFLCWGLCVLGFGFGGRFIVAGISLIRDADAAAAAEPMRMQVQLGKKGTFKAELKQEHVCQHGMFLQVEGAGAEEIDQVKQWLAGLKGMIVMTGSDGKTAREFRIWPRDFSERCTESGTDLVLPMPFIPAGTYQVALTVIEPAGIPGTESQTLVGRNFLCGLEYLNAYINLGIGGALLLVCGVFASLGLASRRKRLQSDAAQSS